MAIDLTSALQENLKLIVSDSVDATFELEAGDLDLDEFVFKIEFTKGNQFVNEPPVVVKRFVEGNQITRTGSTYNWIAEAGELKNINSSCSYSIFLSNESQKITLATGRVVAI